MYELNTLVASNRRNTTLNYRDKLARKYSGDELERKLKEKLYQKGFFE